MSHPSRYGFLAIVCVALTTPAMGQSASTVQRTAHGDPDIQGLFTFRTLTPLQRPIIDAGASALLAGRETLTAEEAAAYEASRRRELNRDTQDLTVRAPGVRYQSLAEGGVGGYNEFWYERGIELTRDKRTSLIVDPPDGRIPYREAFLAEARVRGANISNGFADSYTDRSLSDRCLLGFNAGPPMVSSAYNNNVLIVQTPDHVVILNEMVHNARIIPLDGRPHVGLDQYSGDSRGRWDGDTLVVNTKHFLRETSLNGSSRDTILVERFRRLDADTVMYEFTVEDPNGYTRPWTALMPLRRTDGPLFEYACHEGNIGLAGILGGARNLDTQRILPDADPQQ
ncbi:MAG: hypothetical protein F4Y45_02640 [Acidobacteria bacterium]|nr:hypothetical protein [Acidobacteriota bacterium]MYJ03994.1 hypothetical protein [Acidobacteriota bacterium]